MLIGSVTKLLLFLGSNFLTDFSIYYNVREEKKPLLIFTVVCMKFLCFISFIAIKDTIYGKF